MNQNTDFIPFAKPCLGAEEENAVLKVMRSGWLTTGSEAIAFEKEFAEYVNTKNALALNSATSGLLLALEALKAGQGDTIITSPYTFTSTAASARHLGSEVEFCDTAPNSYNINPTGIEKLLSSGKKYKAIIVIHVGGQPCDMESILAIAKKYSVPVIEDAAHSFPSKTKHGFAGTLADIGVYSFYATKTITTGEGGMLVTNNDELASRVELMRMHGFDRVAWDRYTSKKPAWLYSVTEAGYKCNLPDILAAIGRVQLKKAATFLEERKSIAAFYDKAFSDHPGLRLPPGGTPSRGHIKPSLSEPDFDEGHSWHLYSLRVIKTANMNRDILVEKLSQAGIGSSVHFIPLHIMPYYAKRYKLQPGSFPNALGMFEESISLPIWQGMGMARAERVAQTVLSIMDSEQIK